MVTRVEALQAEAKELHVEISKLNSALAENQTADIEQQVQTIKGVAALIAQIPAMDVENLRALGDKLRDKIAGVIVLASVQEEGKISLLAMATKEVVSKGIHAGNIIKEIAKVTGGGGGGRPDMAQAGGKDVSKLPEALQLAATVIEQQIK